MHEKGNLLCVMEQRDVPINKFGVSESFGSHKSGNILTVADEKHQTPMPSVEAVSYSADGRTVACAYSDSIVRIWDLALCEIVQQLHGHDKGTVWSAAFAPTGSVLLTGGSDRSARVWDTKRHGDFNARFEGHTKAVTSIACAPDGKSFVSSSFDNTVRAWDMSGASTKAHKVSGALLSAAYSLDGKLYAAAGYDKDPDGTFVITIFDAANDSELTKSSARGKSRHSSFLRTGPSLPLRTRTTLLASGMLLTLDNR